MKDRLKVVGSLACSRTTAGCVIQWILADCVRKFRVRNPTRNQVLAEAVEVADTSAKRREGLLKHEKLEPGQGLWIVPCEAVHTFGMKFPIDVLFLDRKRRVRKLRHSMPPQRISACLLAHSVLELPAGTIAESGTEAGDELVLE